MIEIKKILVAVDFSEHSEVAVRYAAEFADRFDAEVILCHVVPTDSMLSHVPPGGEGYFPPNYSDALRKAAETKCEELLAETGIKRGSSRMETGTPFVELIRVARTENVDLLLCGTHGRGAMAHILMGTVAERLVRKAPCPVLVVREGEHDFVHP